MAKQHVELMTALGVPKEQIDEIEGLTEEQLKDWKPDAFVDPIKTRMKTVLSNDPDFLGSIPEERIPDSIKKRIESGQYARFQNELEEVAMKKLGLTAEDLTPEDKKSIKGYAEKMANVYLAKKGNTEGLKEMQSKMSEALQNLEKVKTESATELNRKLEEVNGQNTAKLIKTLAKSELSSIPDVKLNVAAKYVSDPILSELSSKYAVVMDENDNLTLKQKGNVALDVLDSAGNKVTFAQAAKAAIITLGLGAEVKEGGDDDGKGGKTRIIIGDEGGDNKDLMSKVPEHLRAKMKATMDMESKDK